MFGIEIEGINASLFLFYIALGTAWMWNALPPDLIALFNKNRTIQMVFAYLALVYTIDLYNPSASKSVIGSFLYSALLFLWFILTSKLHLKPNLAIMIFIFIGFLFYKHKSLKKDALSELEKKKESYFFQQEILRRQIKRITHIQHFCFFVVVMITLIGNVYYMKEHFHQYYNKDKGPLDFILKYLFYGSKKYYPTKT